MMIYYSFYTLNLYTHYSLLHCYFLLKPSSILPFFRSQNP